ncbi:MAG: ABC transporter ATP-binding protein [bacterium]
MKNNFVVTKQLFKSYKSSRREIDVLKNINLSVKEGKFIGIFGKSGSGKTTLMNMLTGIDKPTQGEVWIDNEPIHQYNETRLAEWRGKNVGIIFQFFQLLPMLSVIDNIILPMDLCKKYKKIERKDKAMFLLEKMGIKEQANKFPNELSGGQQQRVAIARALANNPKLLVADEPTGNLDSKTSKVVFDILKQQANDGKTVLIVTHDNSTQKHFDVNIFVEDGFLSFK